MILPISRFVSTKRAIWISFAVSRSRDIIESLLNHFLVSRAAIASFTHLRTIPDCGTEKKPSQVLLHGARTNAQLAGNFLVAAAFDQQIRHLLVSGRSP